MKRNLSLLAIILLFTACKTQEQIRREQQINTMSVQMSQNQQLAATTTVQIQNMEERLQKFEGVIDESIHSRDKKQQELEEKIKSLEELVALQTEEIKKANEQYVKVEQRLSTQDQFIQEILKTLKDQAKAAKKKKVVKKRSAYDEAMFNYKKGRYKTARTQLEALFNSKNVKGSKRARVIHNLGMISFMDKRHEDSLTYFSKLFTEFPKSTYNANGLIYLAKTFKIIGQADQAKEALNQMMNAFPKHKRVKIAKDMLKKL
jgi:TolA-binding protein